MAPSHLNVDASLPSFHFTRSVNSISLTILSRTSPPPNWHCIQAEVPLFLTPIDSSIQDSSHFLHPYPVAHSIVIDQIPAQMSSFSELGLTLVTATGMVSRLDLGGIRQLGLARESEPQTGAESRAVASARAEVKQALADVKLHFYNNLAESQQFNRSLGLPKECQD